ncbi:MAG: phenylalanine--tRNA ligase subunit alpha [archaeon]|nr:phenylalanine--tRNA ligase subunit alpha [archaeon]
MELKNVISSLSAIERQTLKALEKNKELSLKEIAGKAKLDIDSVRRSTQWLKEKGLAEVKTTEESILELGKNGKTALEKGLPEKNLLHKLSEKFIAINSIDFPKEELQPAIGFAKNNEWIELKKETELMIKLSEKGKHSLKEKTPTEKFLEKLKHGISLNALNAEEKKTFELLKQRKNFVEIKNSRNDFVSLSHLGEEAIREGIEVKGERTYNVLDPVPKIFIGKKQPYNQFTLDMRKKLISIGFQEMKTSMIVQEFYNFDALFQPQNHPARTWTDSYQLKNPSKGILPDKKIVEAVKSAHENGGKSGSTGWQYKWNPEIAMKLMPAAHATAHSARQMVEGINVPGKYFAISRVFRPDVLDATHLSEFNQLDGFIVAEELNFKHLLGILKEFAIEFAGATKVKFFPDYYPFTRPSCQLSAYTEKLGWVELGGAGIFRPEITKNLGIKQNVIAWGLGIDRLALFKLGIADIRQLFSNDLEWLRKTQMLR